MCVVAGFGLYAVAASEMMVRVAAPQAFVPREVIAAPYGVRMNQPGARYRHVTPETTADIEINSQGLRAPRDFEIPKPANVTRVAVFGDSYFLGYEGRYEEIATTQLERRLKEAGCLAEVLNFSVSGFGAAEMLRTFEAKALDFQPDLVIFQWHHTDPDDDLRAHLYELNDGELRATGARYTPATGVKARLNQSPVYRFLSSHSHLFIALREKTSRTVRRAMAGHVFRRDTASEGEQQEERRASKTDLAILAEAERLAQSIGAPFYVVDVPGVQNRMRFRTSFRLLPAEMTARPNYVTPINAFNAAAAYNEKLYWERGHKHLTPKGNAIMAEVISSSLLADPAARKALACPFDASVIAQADDAPEK